MSSKKIFILSLLAILLLPTTLANSPLSYDIYDPLTGSGGCDCSDYVPYTGATGDVNLGVNDLKQSDNAKHYFGTADDVSINYNGTAWQFTPEQTTSEIVFNEGGLDTDFRIESDTKPNVFFVDGGTGYIGVGTKNPSAPLTMVSESAITYPFNFISYATPALAGVQFMSARGTEASPSQIKGGDYLGVIGFRGYDSSGSFTSASSALIAGYATQDYTSTAQGSMLLFWTTPNGATGENRVSRLQINENGDIKNIGGGSLYAVDDNKNINLGTGDDARLMYDGTNLIIDSRQAGSGYTYFHSNSTAGSGLKKVLKIGEGTLTTDDGNYIEFSSSTVDGYGGQIGGIREGGGGANALIFRTGTNAQAERLRITDGGDIKIPADSKKLYFGAGDDASITYDGTNLVFNTHAVGSGLAYFSNNVSATGFITRTSVYDKSQGKALDKVKDASSYLDGENKIKHEEFYGYTPITVIDYAKPSLTLKIREVCNESIIDNINCINETYIEVTYPNTKLEGGVDLGKEIDLLRQAVYELNQDNIALKSELCNHDPLYSWCKK